MNTKYLFYLLPVISGIFVALQAGVNTQLRQTIGSPLGAAFLSFLGGTLILGFLVLVLKQPLPTPQNFGQIEWYKLTGGLFGACFVTMAIITAPKIGVSHMTVMLVAGQLGMTLLMDNFGWLGFPKIAITPYKIIGMAMVIVGAYLVVKK
jgi:transporter family-2 protein